MPTIEVNRTDLESLLGEPLDESRLLSLLPLVKGEIKEWDERDLKIELNDSNRPDLWSPEGIARQIRIHRSGGAARQIRIHSKGRLQTAPYPFFTQEAAQKITVSKSVSAIRPYLGGFLVRGLTISEQVLTQLIQSQEKLADIFGQKRKTVSIGLYPLHKITFPVRYDTADPETTAFIPLGTDRKMSLSEILKEHPKGIAFAGILKGHVNYPILIDANDQILSFPPIINSRGTGEVKVSDTDLLVEVTGTNLRMVMLAVNIFACNLFDRGGIIEPLIIEFPEETNFGTTVKMPYAEGIKPFSKTVQVALIQFEKGLGEAISLDTAQRFLVSYGYNVSTEERSLTVQLPPYRDDLMHPVDVVEDFAISRGYETFVPTLPSQATIGSQSASSRQSARLVSAMIGFGFEEVISNLLSSHEEQSDWMGKPNHVNRPEGRIVAIENPMTERYAVPRSWILPSLLRVEGKSSKAYYPHRLFEVGEVVRLNPSGKGCETALHLAGVIAYAEAKFSDLHAVVFTLFHTLGFAVKMQSFDHPTFIEGRAGALFIDKGGVAIEIGMIGEVHPEVLTRWEIGVPTVAFEIEVGALGH
ncbi:MAG: phenylalanine--tRNA ligase subunit beta [Nitrospirota bacterium]